jgi:hypothetical protein
VFPGNWHIKVTEENSNMLGEWRSTGFLHRTNGIVLSEYRDVIGYWIETQSEIPTHCQIEITTEQFVQYVLNQPSNTMPEQLTPEQQYDAAVEQMNLQPGDTVMVAQGVPSFHRGWANGWNIDMDNHIGGRYEVDEVISNRRGVKLRGIIYSFPIWSLTLVRRANDVEPTTPTETLPTPTPTVTIPPPEPTSNLENEAQDEVVVTTEKVICLTDKWNYINLGGVYEVTKKDEYYTYVKDEVGGESRYAHHYFEEWVHEDLRAKRDQFRNLFGDHSARMFLDSGDEVKKLLAELYPKQYKYNDWIKLIKADNNISYTPFKSANDSYYPMVLMNEDITTNESVHGYLRFDHNDVEMNTFISKGYTYIRFRPRH